MTSSHTPPHAHELTARLEQRCRVALSSLNEDIPLKRWSQRAQEAQAQLTTLLSALELTQRPLVLLLFGGTGVGKSTLLNALARERVSESSSGRRAFTSELHVYVHHERSLEGALEGLGLPKTHLVVHQHHAEALKDKVIIDAPDIDSTELSHHDLVCSTLPVVDVVLYVTSWQKYRDRLINEALSRLSGAHYLVCLLNQADELNAEERAQVEQDARAALSERGFERAPLLSLSARARLEGGGDPALERQFEQLDALLREELMAVEVEALTSLQLSRRALRALGQLPHSLGLGSSGLEGGARALREGAERCVEVREQLARELRAQLRGVLQERNMSEVRGAHLRRDEHTRGPYQQFLRVRRWLWRQGYGEAPPTLTQSALIPTPTGGSALSVEAQEASLEALSAPLKRAERRLYDLSRELNLPSLRLTLTLSDHELSALMGPLEGALAARLTAQAPRPAWQLNTLPWIGVGLIGAWVLSRLWEGREPGVISFTLMGGLLFGLCQLQYELFSALDERRALTSLGDQQGDEAHHSALIELKVFDVLTQEAARLTRGASHLEQLTTLTAEVASLHNELNQRQTERQAHRSRLFHELLGSATTPT